MAIRSILGKVGGAVSRVAEGVTSKAQAPEQIAVRSAQQHLIEGRPAAAWALHEKLQQDTGTGEAATLDAEALATYGVAAAATGRHQQAAELLADAIKTAKETGNLSLLEGVQGIADRVGTLLEQSMGKGDLLCGPLWKAVPPPEPKVHESWRPWVCALPKVAEYTGPVQVRWAGDPESNGEYRGRGLFTTRKVPAGEALLVAWPIARAESSGPPLVAALQRAMQNSKRARQRLKCLDDGTNKRTLPSPEETDEALGTVPDEPADDVDVASDELGADPNLEGIISTNVFSMQADGDSAFLYGLPSILNHSCSGLGASALKLVLVFLDGAIIFRAARDLEEGEELCHRYFDTEGPLHARRELSSKWGFACTCPRCSFEDTGLGGTNAAVAVEIAMKAWRESLRSKMRELDDAANIDGDDVTEARVPVLQELLALADAVESSASAEPGWAAEEVSWCLSNVQPMSNAALYCVIQGTGVQSKIEQLALRCKILGRIVAVWDHTERFGFDHLKNLLMHWSSLEELRRIAAESDEPTSAKMVEALKDVSQARFCCERGFHARFGIQAEDLALGTPNAQATFLLRRLQS